MTRMLRGTLLVFSAAALLTGSAAAQQPAPGNVQATASGATTVKLTWNAPAAANGYVVQRGIGQDPLTRLTPDKITATAYTDAAAPAASTLRYRVKAFFPGGATSLSAIVSVTTPSTPATTASKDQPSAPVAGQSTIDRSSIAREPHPAGFTAVPASPVMASVPPSGGTPAPATSGRYRVVANGLSVVQQAHSHHDDVYGGFVMLHFNRQTGQLLDRDSRHTDVVGDINGRVFGETDGGSFPRLRGGTASPSGGLKNGDSYPDAALPGPGRHATQSRDLPLRDLDRRSHQRQRCRGHPAKLVVQRWEDRAVRELAEPRVRGGISDLV
jgi:hypothetical protein